MLPIQSDRSQPGLRHLGRPWTHDELPVRYAAANRRGGQLLTEAADAPPERRIALLASAIPSAATLSVAIHLLHALPAGVQDKLGGELLADTLARLLVVCVFADAARTLPDSRAE
jgi:hypothetical protein